MGQSLTDLTKKTQRNLETLSRENRRLSLHKILVSLLGTKSVYYQPPESKRLRYPCIIYEKSGEDVDHADNLNYKKKFMYDITVISRNPDDETFDKVSNMDLCSFNRAFVSDNLYHEVYRLYF